MKLEVFRFNSADDFTNGILFDVSNNKRQFLAYTLEDQYNPTKIHGMTRIPAGTYKITLRTEGGFHSRYLKRYGADWHKGMIWVREVPNYSFILLHVGNKNLDTKGCLLVGKNQKDGFIGSSRVAYEEIYPKIRDAVLSGEDVSITYTNFDGDIISNKATDYKAPAEDNVLEELKQIKTELTALRKAWILKGLQVD